MSPLLYIAVEDAVSMEVAKRMVAEINADVEIFCLPTHGNQYLRAKLPELIKLSKNNFPVFMLTDLDQEECAATLIRNWSGGRRLPAKFLLRVAVREVEAWLLADRDSFTQFSRAPKSEIPLNPEQADDPKQLLLNLISRYATRELKNQILPAPNSKAKVGIGYNDALPDFVKSMWSPERARVNSDSLNRAWKRLATLAEGAK